MTEPKDPGASEAARLLSSYRRLTTRACNVCGQEYQTRGNGQPKYCSNACKMKARHARAKAQKEQQP